MQIRGWVELDGKRLSSSELQEIIITDPRAIARFGGEFLLTWGTCTARDHFGIIPGPVAAGAVVCEENVLHKITPQPRPMDLEEAITTAVHLRSNEGVCAISGGVDSSFVAYHAGLPCLAVGFTGSHDLDRAQNLAKMLSLSCDFFEITEEDVKEGLNAVIGVIPEASPVNTAIAVTQYLVTRSARDLGHERVLTGQGADELFGGYARYLTCTDLAGQLASDFAGLAAQAHRDQSVAALNGTYLSMPYLDVRVVRAARAIPPGEMVHEGIGKWPLRRIAADALPREVAWQKKKAMQYGTGVWRAIRALARKNGYKGAVQGYITHLRGTAHGE
ncbi:MAG: asparagine synthase-related protein [Methanomicrobiales archaeon]|nr:asparagine synthase-related protein [Methanomicrobiales archaeon]